MFGFPLVCAPSAAPRLGPLLLAGLISLSGCRTESADAVLPGKRCSLVGECVTGYVCHPRTLSCVGPVDEARLRAENMWDVDPLQPVGAGGGASGGSGGGAGGPPDPGVSPPPVPTVPRSDSGPPDAGLTPAVDPLTGALKDRLLLCGRTPEFTCMGNQVCCARYGVADSCITPGGPCDCSVGCDVAHCSAASDCPAGTVCCFERTANPGGTRCKPEAECLGQVLCDEVAEDCTNRCTYREWRGQECP